MLPSLLRMEPCGSSRLLLLTLPKEPILAEFAAEGSMLENLSNPEVYGLACTLGWLAAVAATRHSCSTPKSVATPAGCCPWCLATVSSPWHVRYDCWLSSQLLQALLIRGGCFWAPPTCGAVLLCAVAPRLSPQGPSLLASAWPRLAAPAQEGACMPRVLLQL